MQHGCLRAFVSSRAGLLGLWSLVGLGCDDAQSVEPTVDPRPGIEQVGSADGALLDEDEACEALHEALSATKAQHGCDEVAVSQCPDLIRPAGSLACVRYAEASVEACVAAIEEYSSCRHFVTDACVIVAVVDEQSEGCVPPGSPVDAGADGGSEEGPADDVDPSDAPADAGSGDVPSDAGGGGTTAPSDAGGSTGVSDGTDASAGTGDEADAGEDATDPPSGFDSGAAVAADAGPGDAGDAGL